MMNKTAINRYKLPVPKDQLQHIDRSSSPAHQGNLRNAIDFIADEETPVLAAADGIVTFSMILILGDLTPSIGVIQTSL
jgi:murein DD-endopeptidase MepM/ murein hydrolase activator NlpD